VQFISQILEHPSLIAYFSGASNYTWLQFRNGERRLLSKSLTYFEEQLPSFVRIHKTALVNPTCVVDIEAPPRPKMAGLVRMHDGTELPVSRRRWEDVARLLQARLDESEVQADEPSVVVQTAENPNSITLPPVVVLAVMTGDALLLARESIKSFGLNCLLQHMDSGAALANSLLLWPLEQRPALVILDARTSRSDRIITLRSLKSHPQLRAIPVVWLAAPGEDTMQAYALNANSVVVVSDGPVSFTRIIEQLCQYWLTMVQLPPEVVTTSEV
jgi:CheY-like chemotaxis protein